MIMKKSARKKKRPPIDDDQTRIAAAPAKATAVGDYIHENLIIEGIVGEGGMGRVFLGYDEVIGRRVAVKELLDFSHTAEAETIKKTFLHEAKLTGKLEHPGIIPVYEVGQENRDTPYYIMRYVRGETLETLLKQCDQHPQHRQFGQRMKYLDVLIDTCETIAYAHSKGVIHRDLKPGNIITGEFGETVILDWGLAQVLDDTDNTYFYREAQSHQRHTLNDTLSTEALGTPAYMAPEQFRGSSGKTSDVYSLGIILFRLMTGNVPYTGGYEKILQQINAHHPTPTPDAFEKSAPPELVAICSKAIQKDCHQRFADAKEMADQLKAFRDGRIVNIYAYSRKELLRRFIARNKTAVFMALALFITILTGTAFSIHYAMRMQQAKNKAENALVTITSFSESSQKQARTIATSINTVTKQLFSDLNAAARQLSTMDLKDQSRIQPILDRLQNQYPKFETFSIQPASAITSISSSGWKNNQQEYSAPTSEIKNQHLRLFFRSPVEQDRPVQYFLEAEMRPERVIPDLFPMMPKLTGYQRDIWIMANDGLIIYDKNNRYQGSNLFLDPQNQSSPTLLSFARLSLTDEDGIGYYSFIEKHREIYKIAAWDTVSFNPAKDWIVIVNYAYMSKPVSGPGTD